MKNFAKNLPQNPKLIQHGFNENCIGNAYVFGPLFNRDEYSEIASHGNDVAGTGLIDLEINGYKPSMDYDFSMMKLVRNIIMTGIIENY